MVTISEGARKRWTIRPFSNPNISPIMIEINSGRAKGALGAICKTRIVVEYRQKAAMAVNDTSMPPAARTSNTPSAKMPVTVEARRRSKRLCGVKNTGLISPIATARSTTSVRVRSSGRWTSACHAENGDRIGGGDVNATGNLRVWIYLPRSSRITALWSRFPHSNLEGRTLEPTAPCASPKCDRSSAAAPVGRRPR